MNAAYFAAHSPQTPNLNSVAGVFPCTIDDVSSAKIYTGLNIGRERAPKRRRARENRSKKAATDEAPR